MSAKFPSPFMFEQREPITLVELRMRFFSGKIRSKPNWWEKVHDSSITKKWREEIVEQDRALVDKLWGGEERFICEDDSKKWPRDTITEAQIDYIFDELKYEAAQRDPDTGIFATSIPKVYESRSLIPTDLKDKLIQAVSVLEDVPEEQKDWHPGSNKQVLDLVHPSLYCLIIGESYVRKEDARNGDPLEVLTHEVYTGRRPDLSDHARWQPYVVSHKYQWLPTDFIVSDSGEVQALGYINNLHPSRHAAMYRPITSILARFVPMFERVLSDVLSDEPPLAVQVDACRWYDDVQPPRPEDYGETYEAWQHEHQWPIIPDPAPFTPPFLRKPVQKSFRRNRSWLGMPSEPEVLKRVEYSLKGRKLQVIVKLANIVLTPESPTYAGGAWHVEGMANEDIVATGLYYYACENITESRLDFRATVGTQDGIYMRYQQSDDRGYVTAYGFGREHAKNQSLGHVVAEKDKCVAFPNTYQHHVDAFELADKSKPGHRKILCFFLVNPETEILSTTHVPPQQAEWSMDELEKAPAMKSLPVELFDMVTGYVKAGVMTREKAEEHRAALMKERSKFVVEQNEKVYELEFNMCEH
ncbi:hypothetical protein L226DRAFT_563700 [Lentinus tigrinus ALCF2SS1-7]|uniref:Uncharacterized protein n=1 Tax=Lentinus tigrinus ALCF2SS1-6 TaxID=1328759 RepID=A0A5C2RQC5_9APHY|nr:hypothetical protein L227DRAFT_604377 [Lentinus tigrinus ALCF2SS1-6]RPD68795.1 hypothetical protein L226DRAFT_563700 [Lentinus tigrinus ALCF2SS1-7]